jgi:uncharacterized protein involved in exopolysaccharide biosynthesis
MQWGSRGTGYPELADPDAPGGPPPRRPGLPVHPYRVFRALWRGRWWLLAAALVGLAMGVAIAKLWMANSYVATTTLKYEGVRSPSSDSRSNPAEVGTLAEAFQIEPVLHRTRQELGLDMPLAVLRAVTEIDADPNAGTVRVEASAEGSEAAADLANTLTDAFLRYHRERREQQLRTDISAVERRLQSARRALAETRTAYDAFRDAHGISDLSSEQQRSIESAAGLRARRDLAESDIEALKARIEQLRRELRSAPRMEVTSSQASTEARDLSEARAELASARSNLSDDHPKVQALERRVATLRLRLNSSQGRPQGLQQMGSSGRRATLETSLSEAQAELKSTQERVASMDSLAEQAKQRVDAFSEIEGEASSLLSQVRIHEQVMRDLESEHAQLTDMVGEPNSGFVVLGRATPPEQPKPSRDKKLAAMASPVILMLLMAAFLLSRELWGVRLWTPAEVAYWGGGPVIGTTSWPRDPDALEALVADMDDFVPSAAGEMLVVGINERAGPLAREIADWLREDWTDTRMFGTEPQPAQNVTPSHPASRTFPPPAVTTSHLVAVPSPSAMGPLVHDSASHPSAVDAQARSEALVRLRVRPWLGEPQGQALRRAARLADRVLVAVPAGEATAAELVATRTRLGRDQGIAFVVVNLPAELSHLSDRIGRVEEFWSARRA